MAAYVIVDLEVNDPARFDEYRQRVPATLAAYGGRFLALRLRTSNANLIFVDGV